VNGHTAETSRMRVPAEALFSLNTAFAGVSLIFSASLSASLPFIHLEVYLNQLLGIRQTDYIRGYFTFWIPSLVLAICLFTLLRFLSGLSLTTWIMQSVAGILILLSPAAVWTCGYEQNGWSLQWPYKLIWGEAALAVICLCIFLKGPRETSLKSGLLGLFAHYLFWYWFTGDGFRSPTLFHWGPLYGGPFGMVLGICALLVWGLYSLRTRQHSQRTASSGTSDHPAIAS
jgi:chromate transport protein ChrA